MDLTKEHIKFGTPADVDDWMELVRQLSVLRMQYFFIRFVYSIIRWESIGNHIFPADVWIYHGVPFGVAEIFKSNRRMACRPAGRVFHAYADGISDMQAQETVPLFLRGR